MSGIHINFFIKVVSWASKVNGILAQLQFRLPGQKCRIVERIVNTGKMYIVCRIVILLLTVQ